MHINLTQIMQEVVATSVNNPALESLAYGAALGRVNYYKHQLLNGETKGSEGFNNHPITTEIKAGPSASSTILPYGNLNSFIGFHTEGGEGQEQLNNIQSKLEREIRVVRAPRNKKRWRNMITTTFEVMVPTLQSIWDLTPYPKKPPGNVNRNGSWADDIETRGVGGFEFYLYLLDQSDEKTFPKSRSGTGLQVNSAKQGSGGEKQRSFKMKSSDGKLRGGMGKVPYIREMLRRFIIGVNK